MNQEARQRAFDTAVAGLRAQGAKCQNGSSCAYRHDGMKCAWGFVIPDELYDRHFEGHTARWTLQAAPALEQHTGLNKYEDANFVDDLQCIHDSSAVEDWEKCWGEFADRYNLVYTPPEQETA